MKNIGIAQKIIKVVRSIYGQATARVRSAQGLTKEIKIKKGVLQGETLSPNLFCVYLNDFIEVIKLVMWSPIQIAGRKIVALMYADDLVLLAANPYELKRQLKGLEEYAKSNKMKVNIDKTKILIFRRAGRLRKCDTFFYLGQRVEIVNKYTYLGVPFSSSGTFQKAHVHFKTKGLAAVGATLAIIGRFRLFKFESYKRIFKSLVTSTATYGCTVWGGQSGNEIEKVQMSFYKKLLGLPKTTPNYFVRLELGLEHTQVLIIRRQLKFLVRILTNPRLVLARDCLFLINSSGSLDIQYNWVQQLRVALDLVSQGWILDGLDPAIIARNSVDTLEKLGNFYRAQDSTRAEKSSLIPCYHKTSEIGEPEKYLLLHMNKVFTRCAVSLRLNPKFLKVGDNFISIHEEPFPQCKFCPEQIVPLVHILSCKSKSDNTCLQNVGDDYACVSSDLDTSAYKAIYLKCKNWISDYVN